MNSKPENIPNQLFDWLESHNFESLKKDQKVLVLQHLTEQEYTDMHQVVAGIKADISLKTEKSDPRKALLLAHFDAVHSQKTNFSISQLVWKIAAGFLLVLCCGLFWRQQNFGTKQDHVTSVINDTLYIVKNVASEPIRIHDTIYFQVGKKKEPKQNFKNQKELLANSELPDTFSKKYLPLPGPLPVLSLGTLHNTSNQAKGNTMKDDSLLKRYSYVSL